MQQRPLSVVRFETPPGNEMQADSTAMHQGGSPLIAVVAMLGCSRVTSANYAFFYVAPKDNELRSIVLTGNLLFTPWLATFADDQTLTATMPERYQLKNKRLVGQTHIRVVIFDRPRTRINRREQEPRLSWLISFHKFSQPRLYSIPLANLTFP